MSATNRGSEREEGDQYFSKYPVALAICERLKSDGIVTDPSVMMEPSAGAGAFVSAMAETWAPRTLFRCDMYDSLILPEHEERARFCIEQAHPGRNHSDGRLISLEGDFLAVEKRNVQGIQAMIGNPPYLEAEAHVRHALSLLEPDGVLAFLLRINFLASIKRTAGLWEDHPPEYVYVLDQRPSFKTGYRIDKKTGKKVKVTTDACEYAVFVWRKKPPEYDPAIRWLQWSGYLDRFENKVARIEIANGAKG